MPDRDRWIDELAEWVGIAPGYRGADGAWHPTAPVTKRALLRALGHDIESKDALAASLKGAAERAWRRRMAETIVVQPAIGTASEVVLAVEERLSAAILRWEIALEQGGSLAGETEPSALAPLETRMIDGDRITQRRLPLPPDLTHGYHRLTVMLADQRDAASLVIAPKSAYLPPWLSRGERRWGIASPLYALRGPEDWGIGDFGDLERLVHLTQGLGGSLIGLNPLHAPFTDDTAEANPYYASSRLFLNPIHIDLAAAARDERCVAGESIANAAAGAISAARTAALIDHPAIRRLKEDALRALHRAGARMRPRGSQHQGLHDFALFNALQKTLAPRRWRDWPEPLQKPEGRGVAAFAAEQADEIDYHVFVQEVASQQLSKVARQGADGGLYLDFAVGFHPDGAEAWANQDAYAIGARFGAPPDPFSPVGQDWGMPPAHPEGIRRDGFAPLVAALRANMRHARALRIDHAMALQRLYWIPPGASAADGAYVRYPLDDLLAIVALESQRARCLVIGEDLGTVPEGFRERLGEAGVLSYRVLPFERQPDGGFRRPKEYPRLATATGGTHDMPTLLGWWEGYDIECRLSAGLIAEEDARREREGRRRDRLRLAAALAEEKLLPGTVEEQLALARDEPERLIAAIELFLARTPSALLLVNLDDLLAETRQHNLPGTLDQHPNWRQRMTAALAALEAAPSLERLAALIEAARRGR